MSMYTLHGLVADLKSLDISAGHAEYRRTTGEDDFFTLHVTMFVFSRP